MRLDSLEPQTLVGQRPSLVRRLAARLPVPVSLDVAQRALSWRMLLLQALQVWVATRLAYALLTYYFPVVMISTATSMRPTSIAALIRRWTLWDGQWYIAIAQRGYWDYRPTAFFPLYPMMIRLVATVIGPHWALASLIASNLGALLAFCGVAALAAQVASPGDERQHVRVALTLFAAYPLALFLVAAYSDGLFVGLAAFTLVFALRRRWGWVAFFGFFAALCRPVAPALMLPIAWEVFQQYRECHRQAPDGQRFPWARALGALLAPMVSIGAYCAWLWVRFGDPFIFIRAAHTWEHLSLSPVLSIPLSIFAFSHIPMGAPMQARVLLDLAPLLGGLVLTLIAARRAPLAFTLYQLALIYLIASAPLNYIDIFVSSGRYLLAAAPLFVILAGWLKRSEWVLSMLWWSGAVLQAILAIFFLQHGWIT